MDIRVTKSAEKPRRSRRGWIGVGRAGLNAQEPNNTYAVPEPSMGEGTAWVEAPAFMPGRTSTIGLGTVVRAAAVFLFQGLPVGLPLPIPREPWVIQGVVLSVDELVAAGSMEAAKAAGKVRVEGKDYPVREGDILHVRFAV